LLIIFRLRFSTAKNQSHDNENDDRRWNQNPKQSHEGRLPFPGKHWMEKSQIHNHSL
jgi:hypothetical protein